jgi:hypothetical protein
LPNAEEEEEEGESLIEEMGIMSVSVLWEENEVD